jgi:hypothetical protein
LCPFRPKERGTSSTSLRAHIPIKKSTQQDIMVSNVVLLSISFLLGSLLVFIICNNDS